MMRAGTLIRLAILVVAALLLEWATRYGYIAKMTIIPPSQMVTSLWTLMNDGDFWGPIFGTLRNILLAGTLAVVLGFIAGVVLFRLPRVRRALEPIMVSYYALPFFVFYPLAVVVFGMNYIPIVLMGFLFAVIAMVTSTLNGLDRVPAVLHKVGQTLRLGPVRAAAMIQLPAAAPHLFTGIKLVVGYSIAGVIGSEFILANEGLGYSIAYAYNDFDNKSMYALLLFVLLFVIIVLTVLNTVERIMRYDAGTGKATGVSSVPTASFLTRVFEGIIITVIFVALWQYVHDLFGREVLTSPANTVERLAELLPSSFFHQQIAETTRALWLSLLISWVGGTTLGVVLAFNRRLGEVIEPMIVGFQSVPKVTLYPMILLIFGLGMSAKVAFGAMHGLVPMTLISLNAIRSLNPALRRTARALRLSGTQALATIYLPATVPELVTAARLSFSTTFLGVMVGELFASKRGLGYMIMNGIYLNDVKTMMAITLLIGIFAITANGILIFIDNKLHWR